MGSKNVWIGLTRMMWGFDILPGLDANGKPIPIDPMNMTNGITWCVVVLIFYDLPLMVSCLNSEPEPYQCRIIPRSAQHAETMRREFVPI
jgi:hypothetical protein